MSIENTEDESNIEKTHITTHATHTQTLRRLINIQFIINSIIITTALIGLAFKGPSYFTYNQIMSVFYGSLSLGYYWSKRHNDDSLLFYHQTLHWIGLLIASYILSLYVKSELINDSQAGLVLLLILAFALFLSGLYGEISFMFTGLYIMSLAFITISFSSHLTDTYLTDTVLFLTAIFILIHFTKKARK
jgi:hypothetical protein